MSEPTQTPRTEPFKAPVGTRDVLPPESARWQALIAAFAGHVGRAGYGLVQSPMFEEIGVFARMGEGTDVVRLPSVTMSTRPPRSTAADENVVPRSTPR